MKLSIIHQLVHYIAVYHLLLCFTVCLVMEVTEVRGKADLKTKLLIQNIRTHMAQKIDEIVKEKECEEGLTLCKNLKTKDNEADEERSEEIPPPPKIVRGQHKPPIKVSNKDVIQTFLPKVRRTLHKKPTITEATEKYRRILSPTKSSESLEISSEEKEDKKFKKDEKLSSPKLPKLQKPPPIEEKQPRKRDTKEVVKPVQRSTKLEIKEKPYPKVIIPDKAIDKKPTEKDLTEKKKERRETEKVKKEKIVKKQEDEPLTLLSSSFIFLLDPDNQENSLCLKQSQVYVKNLSKFKTWALLMYDASAKLPSGVFQGNINQYGNFDECLSINAVFKKRKNKTREFSTIRGKYCLVNVDLESESENFRKALERVKSFEFIKSTIDDPGHFIPRFSTVKWGICVPSSCLAKDVENFFESNLQSFNESLGLLFRVKVEEDNCVVKDDLKFQLLTGTMITITIYVAVLLTSLYATYVDLKSRKQEKKMQITNVTEKESDENSEEKVKGILMALSLNKNLRKLFGGKDSKRCIECINGIKSIFTIMLYLAHKTISLGMTPFSNRIFLTKASNVPITVFLRASMVYTDGFLLISGVLTSYNLAREISEKKRVSWVKKSIDRFVRLTPPSVAIILFYAYIWDQLGSGPTWNSVVKKNSELCRKYLWRNLLFIQNFFAFEDMCAPQTHQLALDLQLSILAPLFVHLLHTYGKLGTGILQAFFLVSSMMRYITTANNELSVIIYHGMHVSQLYKTANLLYCQTLHRASPYILGTIVGYYLKQYEKQSNMPKVIGVLGWAAAACLAYYSILSPSYLASEDYRYNVQEAARYAALSPMAWSLALAWVIIACHMGHGGKLNQFLCQKVFLVFSRISYTIYLTQFLVFFYNVGVQKVPDVFTVAGSLHIPELLAVLFFSTIVTLFFDIPITEIKSIFLSSKMLKVFDTFEDDVGDGKETKDSEQGSEITEGNTSRQNSEEISEELVEEGDEFIEENQNEENYENENAEQNDLGQEITEQDDAEEEGDDEEEENTTTFQLRLPKFSIRSDDDPEDKDWLIVETERESNK